MGLRFNSLTGEYEEDNGDGEVSPVGYPNLPNGGYDPAQPPGPAPSSGGGSDNSQRVRDEYQSQFGRAPSAAELSSELENLNKYGWDTGPFGGVKAQIDKRATNTPNADGGGNGTGLGNVAGGNYWGSFNGSGSVSDWFSQNGTPEFNAFTEQYTAPTVPQGMTDTWDQTFKKPTTEDMYADPGYDARMKEGMKALQRSAAAKGTLLTGGTAKALQEYGQDYASNEYDKVFGRDLASYGTNYGTFANEKTRQAANYGDTYNRSMQEYLNKYNMDRTNQLDTIGTNRNNMLDQFGMATTNRQLSDMENMNAFDIYNTLDTNYYNRLFQLSNSGVGASAGLGNLGSSISDYMTQLGNARAAGTVGSANAWNNSIGNIGNNFMNSYYASQLRKGPTG